VGLETPSSALVVPTVGTRAQVRALGDSDIALVEATRTGDPDAFLELWTRHVEAVVCLARRLVADENAVSSVVNDAFAVVMIDIAQDRYAHDRVGLEPFRLSVYTAVADLLGHPRPGGRSSVPVLRALHRLPPRMQSVVWYVDVEEMGWGEVERLVGEGPAEVRTAYRLAHTTLRAEWVMDLLEDETVPDGCVWNLRRTGSRAAGWLSWSAARRYDRHLRGCTWCQELAEALRSPTSVLAHEARLVFDVAPRPEDRQRPPRSRTSSPEISAPASAGVSRVGRS
jgi:DNA-directed RNA polymerase specialized sigma24 family protein